MRNAGCEKEARILEALCQGLKADHFEESLRRHVETCPSCTELISVCELFQNDSKQVCEAASLPDAGQVWWRATMAAHRAAAERAMRPIRIVEKFALAVGGGVLVALLIFVGPWLGREIQHASISTGTLFSFSLSSLIVTSVVVCFVLMAGALYTLWAEK